MLHVYRAASREQGGRRVSWRTALALMLGLLFAINGPLGLSVKYRQWVVHFDETYLTSQLAFYPLVLAATWALDASYRRLRVRGIPVAFGVLLLGLAALGLRVRGHNLELSARQRAGLARWEAMPALAAYASRIEERDLVAPDLYYSVFNGEGNWSAYWDRYFRQRFGRDFAFHPTPPKGQSPFARLRLYRFDDGRLRAVSIQTHDSVAVVAHPENLPALLVTSTGAALPLDPRHPELLGSSRYASLTLDAAASALGFDQELEPVWLLPQQPLAVER